jgi:hypothetical protein
VTSRTSGIRRSGAGCQVTGRTGAITRAGEGPGWSDMRPGPNRRTRAILSRRPHAGQAAGVEGRGRPSQATPGAPEKDPGRERVCDRGHTAWSTSEQSNSSQVHGPP